MRAVHHLGLLPLPHPEADPQSKAEPLQAVVVEAEVKALD